MQQLNTCLTTGKSCALSSERVEEEYSGMSMEGTDCGRVGGRAHTQAAVRGLASRRRGEGCKQGVERGY